MSRISLPSFAVIPTGSISIGVLAIRQSSRALCSTANFGEARHG